MSHIARVQRAPRSKEAPNKKRPRLLRAMGRPNSPPPELLKHKVLCCHPDVNPTLVPTGWHETAILPVHRLQPKDLDLIHFRKAANFRVPQAAVSGSARPSYPLSSAAVSAREQPRNPRSVPNRWAQKLVASVQTFCMSYPQEVLEISHNATWIQQIQPVTVLELHVPRGWQHFPGHKFLNLPAQSIVRSGRETL